MWQWCANSFGVSQVLGTPTREEIRCMNPNYTDFRFPQIKAHPWHKVCTQIITSNHQAKLLYIGDYCRKMKQNCTHADLAGRYGSIMCMKPCTQSTHLLSLGNYVLIFCLCILETYKRVVFMQLVRIHSVCSGNFFKSEIWSLCASRTSSLVLVFVTCYVLSVDVFI